MFIPDIIIIGTGNLATNLAPALEQNGLVVKIVYGRTLKSAGEIADNLYQATATDSLDFSHFEAGLFIIAVTDDAIEEISRELILPENAIVLHTSGSKGINILGYAGSPNIGVLYPLQTFSKNKRTKFDTIPILVEGDNKYTEKIVRVLALKLSKDVIISTSSDRRKIHLAAIFVGNFTNSLFFQARQIMNSVNADWSLLAPLIEETINKSLALGPENAQTGPAARADLEVLDEHIQMLEEFPDLKETYQLISQQILNRIQDD